MHNIRQVTHQDQLMKNGFLSGAMMEPPGAYMHTFNEQGIFYFHSDGLKNCLGAVVVVPEPTVIKSLLILYLSNYFKIKISVQLLINKNIV